MLNTFSLPRFPILGIPLPLTISAYMFQDGKPDNVVAGGSVSLPRLRREVLFWDSPLQPKGARGVDSAPHPAFSLITSLHGSQTDCLQWMSSPLRSTSSVAFTSHFTLVALSRDPAGEFTTASCALFLGWVMVGYILHVYAFILLYQ